MALFSDLFLRGARRTAPSNVPTSSSAIVFQADGKVGKTDVYLMRNWAEHSEWIRAAINVRKTQISSAEWDIVPYDMKLGKFDQTLASHIKQRFDQPNPQLDSFRSFIEPIVEDILTLDAGVIEKVRTLRQEVAQLWGVDGGKIKVSAKWDGDEKEPRYFWYPDAFERARFLNRDMLYIMANPATYRVVGLSPLETLKQTIDAELTGHLYNQRQVQNAAPDGMLDLGEGARPEQVENFRSYWLSEVAGKGAMAFIGGTRNAKFIPFRANNRDMQFLEWQIYLVRKIAAVFGLMPQDLGITFDVNRSTSETQAEQTEDRGLRPLLALIQDYFTREIVWDAGYGGPENNLAFRFTRLNIKESTQKANILKLALAGMPWMSINGALIDQGRPPMGDPDDENNPYNKLMANTPLGIVTIDDVLSAREAATPPESGGATEKPAGAKPKGPSTE